jgi:hypothetical protein
MVVIKYTLDARCVKYIITLIRFAVSAGECREIHMVIKAGHVKPLSNANITI